MRTQKAQPTNAFFAAVNRMFGGSSQLPTTAERCLYHETFQSSARSSVLPSNKKLKLIIAILILLFVSIIRFLNETETQTETETQSQTQFLFRLIHATGTLEFDRFTDLHKPLPTDSHIV